MLKLGPSIRNILATSVLSHKYVSNCWECDGSQIEASTPPLFWTLPPKPLALVPKYLWNRTPELCPTVAGRDVTTADHNPGDQV